MFLTVFILFCHMTALNLIQHLGMKVGIRVHGLLTTSCNHICYWIYNVIIMGEGGWWN